MVHFQGNKHSGAPCHSTEMLKAQRLQPCLEIPAKQKMSQKNLVQTSAPPFLWWQRGIVYQIYPLSFQDENGDGRGDLNGIRRRLDYLAWLGVDAVWISPIYPSPMKDGGYDISDYCDISPIFGTLADFDGLLQEVHARGLKLILDFVPNHTSSLH